MNKLFGDEMNKENLKQIREKMIGALATEFKRIEYVNTRVRCPSLKKMCQYINEAVDGFTAILDDWSEYKGKKVGRLYYSRQVYYGHKLTIINIKTNEIVKEHYSTETYRKNTDVARFILCTLEKENEYVLTSNYENDQQDQIVE